MKLLNPLTRLLGRPEKPKGSVHARMRVLNRITRGTSSLSASLPNPREAYSLVFSDLAPSSLAMLCISITFVLLTQLSSCLPPVRIARAESDSKVIASEERTFQIHCLDNDGNVVESFEQPALYLDDEGTRYRCVNPYRVFIDGTFTKEEVSLHIDKDVVKRMALAEYWCQQNIGEEVSDMVAQILIWKVMEQADLFVDEGAEVTDWSIDGFDIKQTYDAFLKWYDDNEKAFQATGTYWVNGPDTQDVIHLTVEERDGMLQVQKSSSVPSLTENLPAYSLEGARYVVYRDRQCLEMIEGVDLICDASGISNTVNLEPGTYYVRESAPPHGYETNSNTYAVEVKPGETNQVRVKDKPIYQIVERWANKSGRETSGSEKDKTSFEGTQITIRYYADTFEGDEIPADAKPSRTWVATSNADGTFEATSAEGDELVILNDKVVCPFGTIAIQETKAPMGFLLEGQSPDSPEDYQATTHVIGIRESGTLPVTTIIDDVARAGVSVRKVDIDTLASAQGDASLADITFDIINANDYPVMVNETSFAPEETVASITTDENGCAQTSCDLLPIGTYRIRESRCNASMRISDKELTVSIPATKAHEIVDAGTIEDEVVRGGLRIGKVSRETSSHVSQGSATLEGAEFSVTLLSDHPVVVNGATYRNGDIVCILTSDKNGIAETEANLLPYGTYLIEEVTPPHGFLLNDSWSTVASIRQDGIVQDYSDEKASVPDQVIRGSIHFQKLSHDTGQPMSGIPFKITSITTGESHLVVSNEKGFVDTESAPHTHLTNVNDAALKPDGSVDDTLLDASAGVWFSGTTSPSVIPNDLEEALPFDTYTIEELHTPANDDKVLISFDIRISETDVRDLGTIFNETKLIPQIQTELTLTKSSADASGSKRSYTYTDAVHYQNFVPGETYTITSTLRERATDTIVSEVTREFSPKDTAGTEQVTFQVTGQLAGTTLVCYEEVTLTDGTQVCAHDDPNDLAQTAYIPSITTHLADENGKKVLQVKDEATLTLIDTVACQNLDPRLSYTLVGTLYDKDTLKPLTNSQGEQIAGGTTIVNPQSSTTATVRFDISSINYAAGRNIVCFEELYQGDLCVAQHCDPADAEQTISIPYLSTELCDTHGSHLIANSGNVTLKDTVTYGGLTPGVTYEIFGTLYDKWTAQPIKDARGEKATSFVSFTADKSNGTVQVTFTLDTNTIAVSTIVAFESLVKDSVEIASHADLLDKAQTVTIPSINTEMRDRNGAHVSQAISNLNLTDTIEYRGLDTSCAYTIVGTLMNANSGQKLKDSNGKVIEVTQHLTPNSADGTCSVRFALDASNLKDVRIVAFETLYAGDAPTSKPLASHTDLNNEQQTVRIVGQSEKADYKTAIQPHRTIPATPTITRTTLSSTYTPTANVPASNEPTQELGEASVIPTPPVSADVPVATQNPVLYSTPETAVVQSLLPHTSDSATSVAAITYSAVVLIALGASLHLVRHNGHLTQLGRKSSQR